MVNEKVENEKNGLAVDLNMKFLRSVVDEIAKTHKTSPDKAMGILFSVVNELVSLYKLIEMKQQEQIGDGDGIPDYMSFFSF